MNGTRVGMDYKLGSTVTYYCDSGYTLVGPATLACVMGADGKPVWDKALPTCKAPCGGHYNGSEGVVLSPNYPHNYTTGQTCSYYITVSGDFVVFGQFAYFQTAMNDSVELFDGANQNARLLSSLAGSHTGETLPLAASNQIMLRFNAKNGPPARGFHFVYQAVPRTSDTQCSSVPEPRYGRRIGSEFSAGSIVRFECSPGYLLHGSKAIKCHAVPSALAQWNDSIPTCIVPCSRNLTERRGTILSPGFPEPYGNSLNCVWRIVVTEGAGIQIQVISFALEHNWDSLEIYDGGDMTAPKLGSFSGTTAPALLNSTSNQLYLHFHTDISVVAAGFHLEYKTVALTSCPEPIIPANGIKTGDRYMVNEVVSFGCEPGYVLQGHSHISCMPGTVRRWNYPPPLCIAKCGGTLYDMASVILSPGFPGNYPGNLDCTWRILLPVGYGALIQFLNFTTEVNHDFLEVRNGPQHSSSLIGQFSGTQLPPDLLSTTHEIVIHFYTDHSQNQQGFKLTYKAYELHNCQDPPKFTNGYIISNDYNAGQSITFECFPGYILVGHPVLTCQHGINRKWNHPFPRCEAPCGYNVTAINGTIFSPGFPNQYPDSQDCTWFITVPHGHGVYINFSQLETEPVTDYIAVWDGPDQSFPQLGIFSGNTALESAYSSFNQVLIKFHSDFSTSGLFVLNFHAYRLKKCPSPPTVEHADIFYEDQDYEIGDVVKYQCLPGFTLVGTDELSCKLNSHLQFEGPPPTCEAQCPANEERSESSGVILSPGFPQNYPNSQTCSWIIKVQPPYTISIYVEMFQSEKQFDELEIFDGPCGQSPLLVALSGNHSTQLNFTSKTSQLYLRWSTDHATNKKGFKIRYTAAYCSMNKIPRNGGIRNRTRERPGSRLQYYCSAGYRLVGQRNATCRLHPNGLYQWDRPMPFCQAISCGIPESPGNGSFHGYQYTVGSKVHYQCDDGFRMQSSRSLSATCLEEGVWSNAALPPLCLPIQCPDIESMLSEHMVWRLISGSLNDYGAQIMLSCTPGFYLGGRRIIKCLANGTWDGIEERSTCKTGHCDSPDPIVNGHISGDGSSYRDTVVYQCNMGFRLIGTSVRICQQDHRWSGQAPVCVPITCGHPGNPANGRTNGSEFNLNDVVNFTCSTGFVLHGAPKAQCRMNGQWSNALPVCKVVNCSDPGFVENAIRHAQERYPESFNYRNSVMYHCKRGFYLLGSSVLSCQSNGLWDRSLPKCLPISCGDPGAPPHATLLGKRFTHGAVVHYSCGQGRTLIGNSSRYCQEDGRWSGSPPYCSGGSVGICGDPGLPPHGTRLGDEFRLKSLLRFSCEAGYMLVGAAERTCLQNGSWSGVQPVCEAVSCGNPGTPAFARIIFSDGMLFSSSVTYACWEGYKTSGLTTRHCTANGTWTGSSPDCTVISCGDPGPIGNGIYMGKDFTFNSTVQFHCNPGYVMEPLGASTLLCTKDGTWNQTKPSCRVIMCGQPPAIRFGKVEGTDLQWGASITYSCFEGYQLSSPGIATCEGSGVWRGDIPQCLPVLCGDPGTPAEGYAEGRQFTFRSEVTFYCRSPFLLVGSSRRVCQEDGSWSGVQPTCIAHGCRQIETPAHVDVRSIDLPTLGYTLMFTCQDGYFLFGGSEHRTCKPDGKWTGKLPVCKVGPKIPSKPKGEDVQKNKIHVPSDVFSANSGWAGYYEYLGKRQAATLTVNGFNVTTSRVNVTLLEQSGVQIKLSGTYKKEENHLLLKVYQIRGPTEKYFSKFKNDNWAMDGYVTAESDKKTFVYQGHIHSKDFGTFQLTRQGLLATDTNSYYGTNSSSVAAAILVPFFALILSGFAFYLYKHRVLSRDTDDSERPKDVIRGGSRTRPKVQYNGYAGHENTNGQASFENPMYDTNMKPTEAKAVRFDTTLNTVCTVV
ncbi:hypothetical protein ACEWY4_021197 [Coilia grayii]|uniref:CUB and sushi domain-containing protein 1 n=1 Tax=Coilia grayii TaxID=363190 RepID=A0ABD1J9H7_9TELE